MAIQSHASPSSQVYNSPSIPPEVLADVSGSMSRVYTLFDRSLR